MDSRQWREATRGLVLAGAVARVAADRPPSHASISIALTGNALSSDLLLADTGDMALTIPADYPMRVVPIPLDVLGRVPAIRILGRGLTDRMRLRLAVELTARNARTGDTVVMLCQFDPVLLDALTPLAVTRVNRILG